MMGKGKTPKQKKNQSVQSVTVKPKGNKSTQKTVKNLTDAGDASKAAPTSSPSKTSLVCPKNMTNSKKSPSLDNTSLPASEASTGSKIGEPHGQQIQQSSKQHDKSSRSAHLSPNRNSARLNDSEYDRCCEFIKKDRIAYIKIEEIEHDLFQMPDDYALAHCVAEDMNMGSGIAVMFSQTFKRRDELYQQRQKQGGLAVLKVKGRYIYYLVTKKRSTGKPTMYTLWCSLKKLQEHIEEFRVQKLAIPRIGCGLDRLEWSEVKAMIEFVFRDIDVKITVCNFQQVARGDESQSKQPKPERKCFVRHVAKPLADIEAETAVIYLGTGDNHVTKDMERLNAKFNFLHDYTSRRKQVGDVIQTWSQDGMYALYGLIVRPSKNSELDFVALRKCILETNRKNSGRDKFFYVALEAFQAAGDDLLLTKVVNVLKHFLNKDIELYVCWPEELQHLMP